MTRRYSRWWRKGRRKAGKVLKDDDDDDDDDEDDDDDDSLEIRNRDGRLMTLNDSAIVNREKVRVSLFSIFGFGQTKTFFGNSHWRVVIERCEAKMALALPIFQNKQDAFVQINKMRSFSQILVAKALQKEDFLSEE